MPILFKYTGGNNLDQAIIALEIMALLVPKMNEEQRAEMTVLLKDN
jgi:hypothetical protein